MSTPAEVVADAFSQATAYATQARSQLATFTSALSGAIYSAPGIALTWSAVAAPSAVAIPSAPTLPDPGEWDAGTQPGAFGAAPPDITIDSFGESAPVLDFGVQPTLDFGSAPVLDFGVKPTIPDAAAVAVPDAPVIAAVEVPSYLALNTPTFAGVDLHADYLTNLETIPTLTLASPTPFSYARGADYASALLTELKANLLARLAGGTGLDSAVEQAIWDRARSRENQSAQAAIDEVDRAGEALGYHLPAGVTTAARRRVDQEYYDKSSTLSRDIAIKQADLEQANLKDTIAAAMDLEGRLVANALELEKLTFEAAKTVAENAIQIHNAAVERFTKEVLGAYQLYAQAYDTIIKGELAQIEVYKAELQAEQTKAEVNRTLVAQYQASIEAGLSQVKIFEAQVGAARTLVEIERTKIEAAGEQLKAYVAGVNGETARVEAYKANAQAQGFIAQAHSTLVQSQLARVEVFKAQASAFSAQAGAQADKARANIAYYEAQARAYASEWDGYRAQMGAEEARFRAIASQSSVLVDGYRAALDAARADAEQTTRFYEANIKQYEGQANYSLAVAKINTEIIQANRQATLEAAKAGAQVYAQLTSSAYSMIHASAGVSASAGNSVSYSYSNDTATAPAAVTSV